MKGNNVLINKTLDGAFSLLILEEKRFQNSTSNFYKSPNKLFDIEAYKKFCSV